MKQTLKEKIRARDRKTGVNKMLFPGEMGDRMMKPLCRFTDRQDRESF